MNAEQKQGTEQKKKDMHLGGGCRHGCGTDALAVVGAVGADLSLRLLHGDIRGPEGRSLGHRIDKGDLYVIVHPGEGEVLTPLRLPHPFGTQGGEVDVAVVSMVLLLSAVPLQVH